MQKKGKKIYKFTAVFELVEEGGYVVTVPALPGCVTEGNTFEEAKKMAKDAIKEYCNSLAKHGEPIPKEPKEEIVGIVEVPLRMPA